MEEVERRVAERAADDDGFGPLLAALEGFGPDFEVEELGGGRIELRRREPPEPTGGDGGELLDAMREMF